MNTIIVIIFLLAIVLVAVLAVGVTAGNRKAEGEKGINLEKMPYKKNTFIFSKNEFSCYKNLKIVADKYNLEVFAKMRLADIVSVDYKNGGNSSWFNRIKSKHIDFILLDNQTMQVKLLVELDDSSHDTKKRQDRDSFVDAVCKICNIKIIHIREYSLAALEKQIGAVLT